MKTLRHFTVGRALLPITAPILVIVAGVHSFGDDAPSYDQRQDVVFAQSHGVAITMDIFKPQHKGNGIGIVDVASGAWSSDRGKIRDHKRARIYDIFCERGYTVFAVRPGSLSRFSCADMVNHTEQAIEWIKDRSNEFQIDPNRLGLTGASAGGHLASLVAVVGETPVAAIGVFFPPTDFLEFNGKPIDPRDDNGLGAIARALAFPQGVADMSDEQIRAGLEAISPARRVTAKAPPFLLIHGDADRVVPLDQSKRLVTELEDSNVPVELIVKPGGGHPWITIHEEVAKLADWFDRQLVSQP